MLGQFIRRCFIYWLHLKTAFTVYSERYWWWFGYTSKPPSQCTVRGIDGGLVTPQDRLHSVQWEVLMVGWLHLKTAFTVYSERYWWWVGYTSRPPSQCTVRGIDGGLVTPQDRLHSVQWEVLMVVRLFYRRHADSSVKHMFWLKVSYPLHHSLSTIPPNKLSVPIYRPQRDG